MAFAAQNMQKVQGVLEPFEIFVLIFYIDRPTSARLILYVSPAKQRKLNSNQWPRFQVVREQTYKKFPGQNVKPPLFKGSCLKTYISWRWNNFPLAYMIQLKFLLK